MSKKFIPCKQHCFECYQEKKCSIDIQCENMHFHNIQNLIKLRDFANNMFEFLKSKNLLNEFSENYPKNKWC